MSASPCRKPSSMAGAASWPPPESRSSTSRSGREAVGRSIFAIRPATPWSWRHPGSGGCPRLLLNDPQDQVRNCILDGTANVVHEGSDRPAFALKALSLDGADRICDEIGKLLQGWQHRLAI